MSEDSNVIDFGARAAAEREMRTGRDFSELDGAALRGDREQWDRAAG